MENRPTTEIVLSSGIKVMLYTYLLNRENREIKRRVLSQAKVSTSPEGAVELESFDPSVTVDVQDLTAKYLIKEIRNTDGVLVTDLAEYIDTLPSHISDELLGKIDEQLKKNTITPEERKK